VEEGCNSVESVGSVGSVGSIGADSSCMVELLEISRFFF
jgi:hypothetical protein